MCACHLAEWGLTQEHIVSLDEHNPVVRLNVDLSFPWVPHRMVKGREQSFACLTGICNSQACCPDKTAVQAWSEARLPNASSEDRPGSREGAMLPDVFCCDPGLTSFPQVQNCLVEGAGIEGPWGTASGIRLFWIGQDIQLSLGQMEPLHVYTQRLIYALPSVVLTNHGQAGKMPLLLIDQPEDRIHKWLARPQQTH